MTAAFQHKRGDSFSAQCRYLNDLGVAEDFTALGVTVSSQVRTPAGLLVSPLTVVLGAAGAFQLVDLTTANWPLGTLDWDIQYSSSGTVFSTQTLQFDLVKDVTV